MLSCDDDEDFVFLGAWKPKSPMFRLNGLPSGISLGSYTQIEYSSPSLRVVILINRKEQNQGDGEHFRFDLNRGKALCYNHGRYGQLVK